MRRERGRLYPKGPADVKDKKLTNKERRSESDSKIISSAISNFGKFGYTQSSVSQIAKDAGVSPGLITQRYITKENLYNEAYETIMSGIRIIDGQFSSARNFLEETLKAIKYIGEKNPDGLRLIITAFNSSDSPLEYRNKKRELFKESKAYQLLREAQEEEKLPKGDISDLYNAFMIHAFHQIDICKKYNLEIPADDYFLTAIGFKDEPIERELVWNETIRTAIITAFYALSHIWIDENRSEQLRATGDDSPFLVSDEARSMISDKIHTYVAEADIEKMEEFYDLDTVTQRLIGKKVIYETGKGVDGRTQKHTLVPIAWDKNGRVTEILAGLQFIS